MAFKSKWLDWGKDSGLERKTDEVTSVSFVSSSDVKNGSKNRSYNKKSTSISTPLCQKSEISTDLCVQRTDKTDKTPVLDGHQVHRIVWQTERATVFQDECGQYWRYLAAYREAWPVVVDGGK